MEVKTLNEIRIQGFEVLVKNLGPADAIRFIQSHSHGSGDYTKERKTWLEADLDAVVAGILERRKKEDSTGVLRAPPLPEEEGIVQASGLTTPGFAQG